MEIGVLLGEKHSFIHDLESFFWVFFFGFAYIIMGQMRWAGLF